MRLLGIALGLLFLTACGSTPATPHEPRVEAPGPELPALAVLHGWDEARAAAWARGDEHALASLYVSGSPAGRRDVALLRRYLARGLHVEDMHTQVLGARVLVHRQDRIVIEVTDRLASAVTSFAGTSVPLPRDRARRHRIGLRLVDGRWRVEEVR